LPRLDQVIEKALYSRNASFYTGLTFSSFGVNQNKLNEWEMTIQALSVKT